MSYTVWLVLVLDLSLSGDHNSIWFFEKETSKLKVNAPVYEGTIVEFKHTVKVSNFVEPLVATLLLKTGHHIVLYFLTNDNTNNL